VEVDKLTFCFVLVTLQGNASGGERAQNAGKQANDLVDYAWAYIARKSVLPNHPPPGRLNFFLLWSRDFVILHDSYF
jgi:hypothetical protein